MKNMFKMMGVALLAGAMLFTACKKDKEDTATNSTATTYSVTVSVGGTSWQTNDDLLYGLDGDLLVIQGEQDTNGFQIICGKEVRNYSFGMDDYAVVIWSGQNEIEGTVNGYINITAIDLNKPAGSISANLKCEMGQIESGMWLEITLANAKMVEARNKLRNI